MSVMLLFLFPLFLVAQGTGGITGRIIDINGAGLPGVNVMVKGTYYGAASDLDGNYQIDKINPGSYDVEVSMIGFKVILKTGIIVEPGMMIDIDFEMEETVLSFGEDVVVIGKTPLFDVDETSSVSRVRSEDIENMVVSSVEDMGSMFRSASNFEY